MNKSGLCLLLFFTLFNYKIHAQKKSDVKYRESLETILRNYDFRVVKEKVCFFLADDLAYTDLDKAESCLTLGKKYGKEDNYIKVLAISYTARLLVNINLALVIKMYLLAEQKLRPYNSTVAIVGYSKCWQKYSKLLHHKKDNDEGYMNILLNKLISIAIKANDSTYFGKNYIDIAQKKTVTLNTANEQAKFDAKKSHLINWLLAAVCLFMFIFFALTILSYQNRKKLAFQKDQVRVSQAMLLGQESERERLARDLHDGLGAMLASIKINLSDCANEKEIDNADLHQIITRLDSSIKELRRIAHNLMPEMLFKFGLESSLRDLCGSLTSENLQIDFQCLGISDHVLIHQQIAIYRIVQELLSNVVKHSKARSALLQISQDNQVFFITIEDDGKGFNPDNLAAHPGIGLSNIKSRVAYLNGKLEILSKDSQPGTSINIELYVKS